jgi:hypothetical protein
MNTSRCWNRWTDRDEACGERPARRLQGDGQVRARGGIAGRKPAQELADEVRRERARHRHLQAVDGDPHRRTSRLAAPERRRQG